VRSIDQPTAIWPRPRHIRFLVARLGIWRDRRTLLIGLIVLGMAFAEGSANDWLELAMMILCGILCFGFSLSVTADIVTRTIGHPWLWLQEVTSTLFIYAIFIGAAVATRRNDHLYLTAISESMHGASRMVVEIIIRLVVLGVALCLIWFGYLNYLRGFGSFRLPSGTPIASLYAIIPVSGILIGLFTVEQLVNGLVNGFDHPEPPPEDDHTIQQVQTIIETGAQR